MTTRELIDLPNHPDLPNVTRKAQVNQTNNNYLGNAVIMQVDVFHFINDEQIDYFPKQVQLIADNTFVVNIDGSDAVKNEDGTYNKNTIGEYDFLHSLIKAKVYTQEQLEDMYILKRIDNINNKLYNK